MQTEVYRRGRILLQLAVLFLVVILAMLWLMRNWIAREVSHMLLRVAIPVIYVILAWSGLGWALRGVALPLQSRARSRRNGLIVAIPVLTAVMTMVAARSWPRSWVTAAFALATYGFIGVVAVLVVTRTKELVRAIFTPDPEEPHDRR